VPNLWRGNGTTKQIINPGILPRGQGQGVRSSYITTIARPGCVTRTVTGRDDAAVAATSAPDDDMVSSCEIACGRMRVLVPVSVTM
jgi:hypothetical protein